MAKGRTTMYGLGILGLLMVVGGLVLIGSPLAIELPPVKEYAVPIYTELRCVATGETETDSITLQPSTYVRQGQVLGMPITCPQANAAECNINSIEVPNFLFTPEMAVVVYRKGVSSIYLAAPGIESSGDLAMTKLSTKAVIDTRAILGDQNPLQRGETVYIGVFDTDPLLWPLRGIRMGDQNEDDPITPSSVILTKKIILLQIKSGITGATTALSKEIGCDIRSASGHLGSRGSVLQSTNPDLAINKAATVCNFDECNPGGVGNLFEGYEYKRFFGDRTVIYNGVEHFCESGLGNAQLWSLGQFKYTTPNGEVASIQYPEKPVKTIVCCPNSVGSLGTCKSDGTGFETSEGKSCLGVGDVPGRGQFFYSDSTQKAEKCKYDCVNNKVVQTECITVECSASILCPASKSCDFTNGKCVDAGTQPPLQSCPEGQKRVLKDNPTCSGTALGGSLCNLGLTDPIIKREPTCVEESFFDKYGLISLIIMGSVLVIVAVITTQQKRMKK